MQKLVTSKMLLALQNRPLFLMGPAVLVTTVEFAEEGLETAYPPIALGKLQGQPERESFLHHVARQFSCRTCPPSAAGHELNCLAV